MINGQRLKTAALVYFIIGAIGYLIISIILFSAGDDLSGSVYLGSIVDVAFYSAIAYVVGDTLDMTLVGNKRILEHIKQESITKKSIDICIEKIDEQQKCIVELIKKIETLEENINNQKNK